MQGFISSICTGSQVSQPHKSSESETSEDASELSDGIDLQFFAGFQDLSMASDSSDNDKDYDIDDTVAYKGFSTSASAIRENLFYGGFITINRGSVRSSDLDLNVDGHTIGVFAYYLSEDMFRLWANIFYGSFSYGGDRSVLGVRDKVDDFNAKTTQLGIGSEYIVYDQEGLIVEPGLGLRLISVNMDHISEADIFTIDGVEDLRYC